MSLFILILGYGYSYLNKIYYNTVEDNTQKCVVTAFTYLCIRILTSIVCIHLHRQLATLLLNLKKQRTIRHRNYNSENTSAITFTKNLHAYLPPATSRQYKSELTIKYFAPACVTRIVTTCST